MYIYCVTLTCPKSTRVTDGSRNSDSVASRWDIRDFPVFGADGITFKFWLEVCHSLHIRRTNSKRMLRLMWDGVWRWLCILYTWPWNANERIHPPTHHRDPYRCTQQCPLKCESAHFGRTLQLRPANGDSNHLCPSSTTFPLSLVKLKIIVSAHHHFCARYTNEVGPIVVRIYLY